MRPNPTLELTQAFFCTSIHAVPEDSRKFFYEGIVETAVIPTEGPVKRFFIAEFQMPKSGAARVKLRLDPPGEASPIDPVSELVSFTGGIYRLQAEIELFVGVAGTWTAIVLVNGIEAVRKTLHVNHQFMN